MSSDDVVERAEPARRLLSLRRQVASFAKARALIPVLYDAKTGWLLTGDTVYPGRVIVKDWNAYRSSIERLVEFAKAHRVSVVLGSHIEMSASGMLFAPGNTYQPGEAPLPLGVEDLDLLHQGLRQVGAEAKEVVTPKVVVKPLCFAQRALGAALK